MEQFKTLVESLSESKKKILLDKLKLRYTEYYEINSLDKTVQKGGIALTKGQQRILDATLEYPIIPLHVVSQMLSFEGEINLNILKKSILLVVNAHDAFKLSFFKSSTGAWLQKVNKEALLSIDEITANSDEDIINYSSKIISETNWLDGGTTIYCIIGIISTSHIKIAVLTHNLYFDAWSYEVLTEQIKKVYNNLKKGESVNLKVEPQILDFVQWQNRWLKTREAKTQFNFWNNKLSGINSKRLFASTDAMVKRSYEGKRIIFELSEKVKKMIDKYSKVWGTTSFMIITSILQSYLQKVTKEDSIVIGTIHANRIRKNTSGLIGYLLNYIPLRFDFSGENNLESIAKKNKSNILDSFSNADIPYESIVEQLGLNFQSSRNPLFDLLFIYENIPENSEGIENLQVNKQEIDRFVARFDMTLSIYDHKSSYHCILEYDKIFFDNGSISGMVEELKEWFDIALSNGKKDHLTT